MFQLHSLVELELLKYFTWDKVETECILFSLMISFDHFSVFDFITVKEFKMKKHFLEK